MRTFIESAREALASIYTTREIDTMARLMLEKWADVSSVSFYADKDKKIPASASAQLMAGLERLRNHEPLEYVLGQTTFAGLNLLVDHRVLIPRPETEELVDRICSNPTFKDRHQSINVLDICTGSGCIALALAHCWPFARVEAWDVSEEALAVAQENARKNCLNVTFKRVDVLKGGNDGDESEQFDLLVSNPPYVRLSEATSMANNVLHFEPHLALFVRDEDPLLFYNALAGWGKKLLKKQGVLYVEINEAFGEATAALFKAAGYSGVTLVQDLYGKDRYVTAIC